MKSRVSKTCIPTLIAVLMLFSPLSFALSLGAISVSSDLNQPLNAEIALYSSDPSELINATVELASNETHEKSGMTLTEAVRNVKFKIVPGSDGKFVIELKSLRPIREPVLSFVVEASTGAGLIRRNYTVHLDPARF